jgi:lysozyme
MTTPVKLSDAGVDLIKGFEGYHRSLPDGRCIAYKCPAGVWTLGWGATVGIKPGMIWTRDEAEAALRRELATFEAGVVRLVTVPLNQNEYDALVSFAYNCGLGALQKSTILRKLNANDRIGAADAFGMWTKGGGRVLPGLVRRRKAEAALFLQPVATAPAVDDEPAQPDMPQSVEPVTVAAPLKRSGTIWGAAAAGGASVAGYAEQTTRGALEAVAELNTLAPVKAAILEAGANSKAVALGLGIFATVLVVSRRVKAHVEGKAG